ncbi:MAG: cation diffusion facilitator family transporter [Dissulfuribacterales bacterium]
MRAVKAAITANITVFALKLGIAVTGGSASMLAEAIHSLADTLNQALLWLGIRRSLIGPSEEFPFGRGKERFVWGLISACGIFFLGAGVTIYHGIRGLYGHNMPEFTHWTWIVLGVSLLAEGISFYIAFFDMKTGDTTTLAVLMEDGAAILGVVIAALSIWAAKITGNYEWDAIGSILVGCLLGIIALVLIKKNLEYLLEKTSPEDLKEEVKEVLQEMPLVEDIKDIRMIVLTPESHRIRAEVEINGYLLIKDMEDTLREEYEEIHTFGDFLQFCASFANRITRIVGSRIDGMEKQLQKRLPYLKSVDIKPS